MLDVIAHLLGLYVAMGMMLVGFAYMFAGKAGGTRAAHFYFTRSSQWALRQVRSLFSAVLISVWAAFTVWVGRPLLHAFMQGLRWFATRERGWLRR